MIIVLISGKAGSGKTTLAGNIISQAISKDYFPVRMSLAFAIKEIAIKEFNWDRVKDKKGRRLLQQIGMIGREYYENIWVSNVLSRIQDAQSVGVDFVVIDDWRFPNELNYLKRNFDNVFTVRIVGARKFELDEEASNDPTETSLTDDKKYDIVIDTTEDGHTAEHAELIMDIIGE